MSKKNYPKKVTKDNIDSLLKEARRIEKSEKFKYRLFGGVTATIIAVTCSFLSLSLVIWVLQSINFVSLFPSKKHLSYVIFNFVLFFTVYITICYVSVKLSIPFIKRVNEHFGYPSSEEMIFSESILIGDHIVRNNRMIAKKGVNVLLFSLSEFATDFFNPKRKMYGPEIDLLVRGRSSFHRMVMFSKKENANTLMNFGLAFVRADHPEAFSNLKKLNDEILKYGEPKGRFHGFFSMMERYPHSTRLIVTTVVIVVSIILILCGYVPLPWG